MSIAAASRLGFFVMALALGTLFGCLPERRSGDLQVLRARGLLAAHSRAAVSEWICIEVRILEYATERGCDSGRGVVRALSSGVFRDSVRRKKNRLLPVTLKV